jgi:hypothetical protein
MIKGKRLGIWMDHSSAHLTEFSKDPPVTKIIESKFTHEDKEHSLFKGESLMHKKEQHKHAEYYKEIGEAVKNYEEVVLFGPTDAKVELLNILRSDHLFSKIRIDIKQTDKMTEYQQHEFVKDYFGEAG